MIRDTQTWEAWERGYQQRDKVDYYRNLRVFEALYTEAQRLGVLPPAAPLAGIETRVALARDLNVPIASRTDRPRL